jgi:serine/threonine protein phosphatase 1
MRMFRWGDMERTIVIGDVHGCATELEDLLAELKLKPTDRVIFVGDLVNRGPNTSGVLRIARSIPGARSVLGNHEVRLLEYRRTKNDSRLKSYDRDTLSVLTEEDWKYLHTMEERIELPEFQAVVVHGGFLPGNGWRHQPLSVITRIQVIDDKGEAKKRSECKDGTFWADRWAGPPFVVYGHTPSKQPIRNQWAIGIDTGVAYGGALSAFVFPDRRVVSVPARRVHVKKNGWTAE